jgi:hypothetical protein
MHDRVFSRWASLSLAEVILFGVALAIILEAMTVAIRFGLGLQSTRDTAWLAAVTFGLRIHHGYMGVLLAAIAVCVNEKHRGFRNVALVLAVALVVSDLLHHFAVLWPLTGSPRFDLWYPGSGKLP